MSEVKEVKTFDDLGLDDNLLRGIYSHGFENPSPIQGKAIPFMNSKKDLIAQAQSGTGKTGAFSIGILNNIDSSIQKTQALVINPTHELANQNLNVIKDLSSYMKINVLSVVGGTNVRKCQDDLRKEPHVIVGTPGRILDMIQKQFLYTKDLKLLIFDEADEILSYGFKENIYNIIQYIPKDTQICIYSATMPPEVLDLTDKFMNQPERILVQKENLTLDGIIQFYINVKVNEWKFETLIDIYDTINVSQCIIYINSKNKLMEINDRLKEKGFPVECIHGELSGDLRKNIMDDFKSGKLRILLSTDLLSRGIDIQQLSLVINYDLPREKETYIHRIGRSGRYGRKGVSINFVTDRDMDHQNEIQSYYNTKIEEMPQNINDYLNI
jgi:superfamily II DNA/RNA helicase